MTYTLPAAVRGEMHIEGYGLVPVDLPAGPVDPVDELQATVLARLATTGRAELVDEVAPRRDFEVERPLDSELPADPAPPVTPTTTVRARGGRRK